MPKIKPVKAWGGFCDGKLNVALSYHPGEVTFAVYETRREARKHYEDVRPVEIRVVQPKKGRK